MADEQSAVDRLEQLVALASGRIYVPPHVRISEKGKRQNVDGYWRKRKPGEKGNVASLPAGVDRQQPKGRNAGGRRQPGGGINAGDLKTFKTEREAVPAAVDDLVEMEVDDPSDDEIRIAVKQRLGGKEPTAMAVSSVKNRLKAKDGPKAADLDYSMWAEEFRDEKGVGKPWISPTELRSGLADQLGREPNASEIADARERLADEQVYVSANAPAADKPGPGERAGEKVAGQIRDALRKNASAGRGEGLTSAEQSKKIADIVRGLPSDADNIEISTALEDAGLGNEWDVAAVKARLAARNRNKARGGGSSSDAPATGPGPNNPSDGRGGQLGVHKFQPGDVVTGFGKDEDRVLRIKSVSSEERDRGRLGERIRPRTTYNVTATDVRTGEEVEETVYSHHTGYVESDLWGIALPADQIAAMEGTDTAEAEKTVADLGGAWASQWGDDATWTMPFDVRRRLEEALGRKATESEYLAARKILTDRGVGVGNSAEEARASVGLSAPGPAVGTLIAKMSRE